MSVIYFLVAFALSTWLHELNPFLTDDGTNYLRIAQNLIRGWGISINPGEVFTLNPPFYSLLIGLFSKLFFKDLEFSGYFVSTLSFSLTLFPLFLLSRAIYGGKAPHWTSLLYLTNGFLLVYSHLILTEPLFILLMMTLFYQTHQAIQPGGRGMLWGVMLGAMGGLAYLTRPEGFLFFAVGIAGILLLSSSSFPSRLRVSIPALAAFLIFLLPYFHLVHRNTAHWQLSGGVLPEVIRRQLDVSHPGQYLEVKKIDQGLSRDKTRLKIEELAEEFSLVDTLKANHFALFRSIPLALISRIMQFNKYFYGGLGFFLMGAGFLSTAWDSQRKKSEFLLLLFLLPFSAHFFVVFDQRRYLPIYPIFLIWAGNGIETLRNWARKSFNLGQKGSVGIALSACFLLALPSFSYVHRNLTPGQFPFQHKEMGLWMKNNIPHIQQEKVVTHRPFAAYYSGGHYLFLPYVKKFEDLLTYMNHHGARYLVVSDDLDTPVLDSYRFLLDETKPPPPQLIRKHVVRGDHKVILYEIQ